jgi:Domain of unknown function (DUF4252)
MNHLLGSLILAISLLLNLSACGITAPRNSEGFAELDSPGIFDTDKAVSLSIGPALLHFAAANMDDDDEARALLRGLDGVRIRVYEIERNPNKVIERVAEMQSTLQQAGWESVLLVREEGEETHLLVKIKDDRILGLTLLAMEDANEGSGEVVVINLMGEIQPESFSDVMVALDVDNKNARNVQVAQVH